MITLAGIDLPEGIVWPGQTDYCAIKQENQVSITGRTLLSRGKMQDGRLITLVGNGNAWTTLAVVNLIGATRIDPTLLELNYHGTLFKVRWDYSQTDHFVAKHLHDADEQIDDQSEQAAYLIETIKLIEVLD